MPFWSTKPTYERKPSGKKSPSPEDIPESDTQGGSSAMEPRYIDETRRRVTGRHRGRVGDLSQTMVPQDLENQEKPIPSFENQRSGRAILDYEKSIKYMVSTYYTFYQGQGLATEFY